MTFVVWLTGLPGSGKSTIATKLLKILEAEGIDVQHIRLDEFRKILVPKPSYREEERELVYRALVLITAFLYRKGVNVLLDATGHRRRWRALARKLIKNFVEVYVKCPAGTCMERETKRKQSLVKRKLYLDAHRRIRAGKKIRDLGEVIGVDVPYEEPRNPDVIVESDSLTPEQCASIIYRKIDKLFL